MTANRRPWIRSGLPGSTDPMSGLGDLALFLGGDETSFTGELLKLAAKASPDNLARITAGFPDIVRAWQAWMSMSPAPTADELRDALGWPLPAEDHDHEGAR